MQNTKTYSWILIICGAIGLLASLMLTIDSIKVLENPNINLPCNINPLISCGPIMNTDQSRVFGFPNPLLGISGFSAVMIVGIILLFGTIVDKKFWSFFLIGTTFQILFVHYLFIQSVYFIGNLCLYCMITWAISWPIFFFTLKNYIQENSFIHKHSTTIFISWYLLITFLILFRFRDFFFG